MLRHSKQSRAVCPATDQKVENSGTENKKPGKTRVEKQQLDQKEESQWSGLNRLD